MPSRVSVGIALIEVLISLLLLGVVCVGFMVVQFQSAQSTLIFSKHSKAILLADDFIERIRVNTTAWPGFYLKALGHFQRNPTAATANCYDQRCDPEQLAFADVRELMQLTHNSMGEGGRIQAEISCGGKVAYSCVKIAWDGSDVKRCGGSADAQKSRSCLVVEFLPLGPGASP